MHNLIYFHTLVQKGECIRFQAYIDKKQTYQYLDKKASK